jgi:hypothetical protein
MAIWFALTLPLATRPRATSPQAKRVIGEQSWATSLGKWRNRFAMLYRKSNAEFAEVGFRQKRPLINTQ